MSATRPWRRRVPHPGWWRGPAGWTLRTRLLAAMIALLAAVSVIIGLVSVLALDRSLLNRVDDQLVSAANRSRLAVGQPRRDDHRSGEPDHGEGPDFLFAPGQGEGTLGAQLRGDVTISGVLDRAGYSRPLSGDQCTALRALPADGRPRTVDLGGQLGTYRLLAADTPDGGVIVTGLPLRSVRSTVYGLAAVITVVAVLGLVLAARQASEARVRKFVADASHELRTPLASIRGYAELTRRNRGQVPAEVAHALGRVESEAVRMTDLVEDLLLLARLDSGRPVERQPVDLSAIVVDAVSDAHAAGPGHRWQLDLPGEPVTVTGDQGRLHQVVANLLANTRQHTPAGTVVTVSLAAGDEVVLRVADNGPGIPLELQPEVFERFTRADTSRSRASGSTGLGLAIVAAVVEAHRGTVEVDSAPGHTAFT